MSVIVTSLQNNLRKHRKALLPAVICAILLGTLALYAVSRTKETVQAAPPPLEVEVVQVEQKDIPLYSEWIGTTDGMVNAEIRAQVSGYLLKQHYTEGSFVKRGQLLFEIDPRPLQAELGQANGDLAQAQGQLEQVVSQFDQAEAQRAQADSQVLQAQAKLAQAQADQRKAQLDVNRYTPLAEQKAVTQQELDNSVQANLAAGAGVEAAKAGVETAKAQIKAAGAAVGTAKAAITAAKAKVQAAQAAVRTAELNLGFTRIVSPIDGIAGIAQAQVGNLVNPTSGTLTTVSTVDPIKVYFTVSEQEYLDHVRRNPNQAERDAATKQIELELILADATVYAQKGEFFVADRQVDTRTGAIRLAGLFPNPQNMLRPGQYGRVRAVTSTKTGALLVPQRAVTELQGNYQVAVVGDDNKVNIRTVKVGERSGTLWIVEDGLSPDERVVAEGTQKVSPGAIVNPQPFVAPSSEGEN